MKASLTALLAIANKVRLVGFSTPIHFSDEVLRVTASWTEGRKEAPRFVYRERPNFQSERAELKAIVERWPEIDLVRERAAELRLEALACEAIGTPSFWGLCRERYGPRDEYDRYADELSESWLSGKNGLDAKPLLDAPFNQQTLPGPFADNVWSHDETDPGSLFGAMRRAIGVLRLPLRVMVANSLSALAATGEGVILVARGKRPSAMDVARTVTHEVWGHAAPMVRAKELGLALFSIGTAFGSDDQEGRAIVIEEQTGFLNASRKRELALRHVAARGVAAKANFIETAEILLGKGAPIGEAIKIAARVHRGGGLGREVVYLPAFLRVRAALSAEPMLDEILGSGRVAVPVAHIAYEFSRQL